MTPSAPGPAFVTAIKIVCMKLITVQGETSSWLYLIGQLRALLAEYSIPWTPTLYELSSEGAACLQRGSAGLTDLLMKPRGFGGNGSLDGMLVFEFIFAAIVLAGLIWRS